MFLCSFYFDLKQKKTNITSENNVQKYIFFS